MSLLTQLSWPELRHHPWRHLAALLAVMLGVALAFSVQLINQSALSEFSAAVRSVNGQPDFELRGQRDGFDEALYARVAKHPKIAIASPIVEAETQALAANGSRVPLHVVGIDAFVAPTLSPDLLPRPNDGVDRLSVIDTTAIFVNAEAARQLGKTEALTLRIDSRVAALHVAGSIAAAGAPTAVMDIAGAQAALGFAGRLSRIDVRLRLGADRDQVIAELALPPGIRAASPDEAAERVSNVSKAYRVNLTVLALVALFTGAFLVFSILSLSVAKRQPQFALLGVLGMSARARLGLVLAESALLGVAGSVLGLVAGTGLAALAMRLLAGDLGGGYFPGVVPRLQFSFDAAVVYGLLGTAAAMVGGWLPARTAQRLAPAQALKGLGPGSVGKVAAWGGPLLISIGVGLAFAPPVDGIPLAAYVGVACLLLGGIAGVPAGVALLLGFVRPPANALGLLAVERARRQRQTATIAVAGVVASLALAVALTVMVASFRDSVARWLDTLLPADLYLRSASVGAAPVPIALPPAFVEAAAHAPGVARFETQRVSSVIVDPTRPAVALIARTLTDPAHELPLIGDLVEAPPGATAAYVTEAMGALYGVKPGATFALPLPDGHVVPVFVRGVWRDYARQHGAVVLARPDYERLTGDPRVSDLAFWLAPGARVADVETALNGLAAQAGLDAEQLQYASPADIRAASLRIFDRSFAVTYWLQSVAIAIGLFGIAASFSAQVLARRKEFGLLAHLGLTRVQVLAIVAAEGAVWTAAGALLGLALGIAVSVVLVEVVNPQSFHWTMDLLLPWGRLGLLCAAVVVAGTLTAWLAARTAVSRDMALAVKEDW